MFNLFALHHLVLSGLDTIQGKIIIFLVIYTLIWLFFELKAQSQYKL